MTANEDKNKKTKSKYSSSNSDGSTDSVSSSISSTDSDIFSLSEDSFFSNLSEIDELKTLSKSKVNDMDSNKILEMLNTSELVLSTHNLSELFEVILTKAISLTDAESGYLLLRKNESNKEKSNLQKNNKFDTENLVIAHSKNNDIEKKEDAYGQISKTVINKVIETRKVEIIKNALNDENFDTQQSIMNLKLKSIMCAPMIIRDEVIGVIYIENRLIPKIFNLETSKILQFFANQCAIAIENGRLFEEYENLFKNLHEIVNSRTEELIREKQYNEDLIQNLGEILLVVDNDNNIVKLILFHSCAS